MYLKKKRAQISRVSVKLVIAIEKNWMKFEHVQLNKYIQPTKKNKKYKKK